MTQKTCKGCKHKIPNPADRLNPNVFMCIESPPGVIAITVPVNIPGQGYGQQINIQPVFPPVNNESIACSKFQESDIKIVS